MPTWLCEFWNPNSDPHARTLMLALHVLYRPVTHHPPLCTEFGIKWQTQERHRNKISLVEHKHPGWRGPLSRLCGHLSCFLDWLEAWYTQRTPRKELLNRTQNLGNKTLHSNSHQEVNSTQLLCNLQITPPNKTLHMCRPCWDVGMKLRDAHWNDFRARQHYNQQLNFLKLFLYSHNLIAHKSILIRLKNYWTCTSMSCQVLSDNANFTWDQS